MSKKDYSSWSKEELVRELKKVEKRKKYGIVWEDKPEQVALLCKEKLPVLAEDKSKEIVTDKEKPVNILIEGDNYHALSVLNYTHKGKIDVIYIDPPYNTGNEGFIYNDKLIDSNDEYRHSKWLSFIEKRLLLAKNLLKNNGIMFISIDDNEVAQLKLLCDEIFGEHNVEVMVWEKVSSNEGKFKIVKRFRTDHEYIVVVYKNKEKTNFLKVSEIPEIEGEPSNPDNDPRGPWVSGNFSTREEKSNKDSLNYYTVISPSGKKFTREWKFEKTEFNRLNEDGRIYWGPNGDNVPRLKIFVNEPKPVFISSIIRRKGTAKSAAMELENILGKRLFDHPKPTQLIQYLLKFNGKNDIVVLDFFAGSGTTGQSVMRLNEEDNGSRKFILCTNDENKICTKICFPRLVKIIKGFVGYLDKKTYAPIKNNLKYFKTDFVDAGPSDKNKRKMVAKSTEMLCLKEDCFDEMMQGHKFKIFTNGQGKYLGIIYDDDGIEPFKEEAKKMKRKFVVYVFSLDESAREDEFEDVEDLVELKPIPAVILNVYKRIFK